MPIYEFLCRGCGHRFDKLVRMSDTPACPTCSSVELERQFTPTAGISTQKTRKRSMGFARQKATERKKEKDHAQREYETNVIKDHS